MEDVSFPRGGSHHHAPVEEKEDKSKRGDKRKQQETTPVQKDFLFGASKSSTSTSIKKKRKTSSDGAGSGKHSLLPMGGGGVVQSSSEKRDKGKSSAPVIEAFGFSKLAQGTKVLGVIREVQHEFAVVSLPNLLTGYMLAGGNGGHSLKDVVRVGQTLSVVVEKVVSETVGGQKRRRIQVSALPGKINPRGGDGDSPSQQLPVRGQIVSVEDHGCLIDLGYSRQGFLKFDSIGAKDYVVLEKGEELEEESSKTLVLQPGRLYDFLMQDSQKQVVSLTLPSTKKLSNLLVAPPVSKTATPYTLSSITPGWLVSAKVECLAKNGLCVTFLGNVFRGAIEMGHLGGSFLKNDKSIGSKGNSEEPWKDIFGNHQHFQARIIAVDVATKLIRLSLLPHLLELGESPIEASTSLPEIGTIIENCTVVRHDSGIGALLALPDLYSQNRFSKRIKKSDLYQSSEAYQQAIQVRATYVHISKAFDAPSGKKKQQTDDATLFAKEFGMGSTHSVRILSCGNWMDGVASGACASSILEAHVFTHADIQPGQVYKQVPVVAQLQGGSILVRLGSSGLSVIRGLIPPLHLFDTSSSSEYRKKLLKAKYAVDAKIDVRVLEVDAAKKQCIVTTKKQLVKSPHSVPQSFEHLKVGQIATGFVSKMDQKALFVTFCNKVYGKVTARSLSCELGIENMAENYKIGDVVTCRVVKLQRRSSKKKKSWQGDHEEEDEDESDSEQEPHVNKPRSYWEVTLSLNVAQEGEEDGDENAAMEENELTKRVKVQAGAILPLKSMKIVELQPGKPKKDGGFVPGYAIVSIKSKHLVKDVSTFMMTNMECKLPYDQLLDQYSPEDIESVQALDELAERVLQIGKKINQKGIILTDPQKSNVDYSTGIGKLAVVSLRKNLIETIEAQYSKAEEEQPGSEDIFVPNPDAPLFVGALVKGYVAQVDQRHGAFIRFLDGMTGLIPKKNGGLRLNLYETIVTRIKTIDDSKKPQRILLENVSGGISSNTKAKKEELPLPFTPGDIIPKAKVTDVEFFKASVKFPELESSSETIHASIHCSMKESAYKTVKSRKRNNIVVGGNVGIKEQQVISTGHPFYGLKIGHKFANLSVVSVNRHGRGKGIVHVQLADRSMGEETNDESAAPTIVEERSELKPGMITSGIVTGVAPKNKGLFIQVSPFVKGFIPGLELSRDLAVLNNMSAQSLVGMRLKCRVMDDQQWHAIRAKCPFASQHQKSLKDRKSEQAKNPKLFLSVIACEEESASISKPGRGDLVIGKYNKALRSTNAPSMMVSLRGGYLGRCCITELEEIDDWENMPLGRMDEPRKTESNSDDGNTKENDQDSMDEDEKNEEESDDDDDEEKDEDYEMEESFPNEKYVQCRVLKAIPKQSLVEMSLRNNRQKGNLGDDKTPNVGDIVQGYVIKTNKSGCFVRLARHVEGRSTLKELCDGFLHHPETSFPMGRLVVGKVKEVRAAPKKSKHAKDPVKVQVDLDMRESTVLENKKQLKFEDIEVQGKYPGTVTRVESYGVFVQIENTNISGLTHMSECSDKFIKNLQAMYDPGDHVKVIVIKKDVEGKKLGFSMKASHFENDEDSDAESVANDDSSQKDEDMVDVDDIMNSDDSEKESDLDSDDENFASKLAAKMQKEGNGSSSSHDSEDHSDDDGDSEDIGKEQNSDDDSDSKDSDDDAATKEISAALDTDVGFDWGALGTKQTKGKEHDDDSSDDSDSEDEDDDEGKSSSHKSRKKQAQRRREEQEISRRETALADGTADENPETAGDFERLLAGTPNSSELWIRYMAFHLSLSDIPSARAVADKALERIEFRQEREKLNVWTALLTLEHKYGSDESLQTTIARACNNNNPKQVHLRVCEILEKDLALSSSPESAKRANDMFAKMCKKFKSKKKVWLAHLQYLLKQSRHQEAHALLKRALLSLAPYKHAETMSKFAQLEFEFGCPERARTVFDGILLKYPKRLDLFSVYVDKELKFGNISIARSLLERKVEERKLSDKQMKSLFKKWYRIEDQHGTEESREHVKDSARNYVDQSISK